MKIGETIRNAREDSDLTQENMARLIPMNQSNDSKIERDLQEPNLLQLKRICEILHLDPRALLGLGEAETLSAKDRALLHDIKIFLEEHSGTYKRLLPA